MSENKTILTEKEVARREMILNAPVLKTIFTIALPLVFYNTLSQVFQLIDTLIAANMNASVVSTVSFISQIETMLHAVGNGLAVGGGILIARSFGAGDMERVRNEISTLFFTAVFIGAAILAIFVPFAYPFLKLLRMPEDLIGKGTKYFSLAITSTIFQFINTIYFATLKSRGNTNLIMWGNLLVLFLKSSQNILINAFVRRGIIDSDLGMMLLPISTMLAHFVLTIIAVINLASKKNTFQISLKRCTFQKTFLVPLAGLGVPVFLEKFVFAFGKVVVNSMCASMGSIVVGALGVSNRLGGLSTQPMNGFQEGETSLISNNLGAEKYKRALSIFYTTLVVNLGFALLFFILTGIFKAPIIHAFAKGNADFAAVIDTIYTYERLDTILISINTSVMGLLYGFGKTKLTMVLNFVRLFIFRIPPLFLLMRFTNLGTVAVGLAMLISNGMVGITAGVVAIVFIRRMKNAKR